MKDLGSFDSTVRLWDTKTQSGKPLMILSEARDSISALFVLDHEIVTGSIDGRVRSYDIRMGIMSEDVIGCKLLLDFLLLAIPINIFL